jgi:hypothetical protein
MAHFDELPLEILPLVIEKIRRVHALAQACLVNKTFHMFVVPFLYRQICVFSWHGKQKVSSPLDQRGYTEQERYAGSLALFLNILI